MHSHADDDDEMDEIDALMAQIASYFIRSEDQIKKLEARYGKEMFEGSGIYYPWPGHTDLFVETVRIAVGVALRSCELNRFSVFSYTNGTMNLEIEANNPVREGRTTFRTDRKAIRSRDRATSSWWLLLR
jgi:hypothetical protein